MTIFAYSLQFYQIKTTLACCNDFDFLNEEKYFYKGRNAFVLLRRNDIPPGKYSAHLAVHRASWNIQTRVIALISSHYCPWYHPTSVFKFSSKRCSFSIVFGFLSSNHVVDDVFALQWHIVVQQEVKDYFEFYLGFLELSMLLLIVILYDYSRCF